MYIIVGIAVFLLICFEVIWTKETDTNWQFWLFAIMLSLLWPALLAIVFIQLVQRLARRK